ncbi:MAG: sensor histidine kinase [Candidatus Hodarchaeota archaeon]
MSDANLPTKFAPAERASKEEIKRQAEIFEENNVLNEFLEKIPVVFVILNKFRQIVFLSKGAKDFAGVDALLEVLGKRPGELFACIHSDEEEGGCGTSKFCMYCGAVNAVLEAQKGKPAVMDCRLLVGNDHNALNLRVWASPMDVEGEQYIAVTMQDIQDEKWRLFMEQVFFHDILNTTNGLYSTIQIMRNYKEKIDSEEFLERAELITNQLIDEIQSQQLAFAAEHDNYSVDIEKISSMAILEEIERLYKKNMVFKGKSIEIDPAAIDIQITSDRTLLKRILGNMIKNAGEATPEGGKIRMGCDEVDDKIQFWVHNPGFIARDVQLQIFNRSFSTKGTNRGLGTYSMKLLSSFLDGEVTFSTSEEEGTKFMATYPITMEPNS